MRKLFLKCFAMITFLVLKKLLNMPSEIFENLRACVWVAVLSNCALFLHTLYTSCERASWVHILTNDYFNLFTVEKLQASCPYMAQPLGCFVDNTTDRALPDLLFTDRDQADKKHYSHVPLVWTNFATYLDDLVCRCAGNASAKGETYIGLQFWGTLYFKLLLYSIN